MLQVNFVQGGGKNLVKAVFMSVYRRLAANSIQKHLKKRRCPKTFCPGFYLPERGEAIFPRTVYPGMSLSLLPKERVFTSLGVWLGKLSLR